MNVIDNIVSFFDPRAGRERQVWRDLIRQEKFRYDAASRRDRLGGWTSPTTGANATFAGVLPLIRARSRDLARNDAYANKAKRSVGTNAIGTGIVCEINNAKSKSAGDALEKEWKKWALTTKCDADGLLSFYGIQTLAMRTIFEGGEVLIRRRRRRSDSGLNIPFQLQVLEGDYLDDTKDTLDMGNGNSIYHGIEFNKQGQRVAYYLYKEHPGDGRVRDFGSVRVPATEIIHLYRVERAGQCRGVPWMAPAVVRIKDFGDYESAQLVRQKIAACYMAFVRGDNAETALPATVGKEGKNLVDKITPAMIEFLPAGADVAFANPPGPGADYPAYGTQMLRGIAVGSCVPYEVLTGDYSKTNFSSARMSWLEFQREISEWQRDIFTMNFLPRVFEWFLEYAAIRGHDTENAEALWVPQKREMIDPSKEIKAARDEVRSGFNSLSNAIREQGRDPEKILNQIEQDNKTLDEKEIKIDSDPRNITQSGQSQATAAGDASNNSSSSNEDDKDPDDDSDTDKDTDKQDD